MSNMLKKELDCTCEDFLAKVYGNGAKGSAQVGVAGLQASAHGEGCPGMNKTYTVNHIQKGLFIMAPMYSFVAIRDIVFIPLF